MTPKAKTSGSFTWNAGDFSIGRGAPENAPHEAAARPVTVMIVDDDAAIREAVRIVLPKGVSVVGLGDGEEFLEMVAAYRPDIIILDVGLPGRDGFELCRQLRSSAGSRAIPVLFLTAMDEEEGFLRLLDARGDAYLRKPFDAKALQETLGRFVDIGF